VLRRSALRKYLNPAVWYGERSLSWSGSVTIKRRAIFVASLSASLSLIRRPRAHHEDDHAINDVSSAIPTLEKERAIGTVIEILRATADVRRERT
jgi:hypothetical protein